VRLWELQHWWVENGEEVKDWLYVAAMLPKGIVMRIAKILGLMSALFLIGCAAQTPGLPESGDKIRSNWVDFIEKIRTVTNADLDAAIADADAHNDLVGSTCYKTVKTFIATNPAPRGIPDGARAFYFHQRARDLVRDGAGQGIPDSLKLGCAALVQDDAVFLVKMGAIAGSSGALGGLGGLGGIGAIGIPPAR